MKTTTMMMKSVPMSKLLAETVVVAPFGSKLGFHPLPSRRRRKALCLYVRFDLSNTC